MLKRILITAAIVILTAGFSGGYFYHTGSIVKENRAKNLCTGLCAVVKDSLENKLISSSEICEIVRQSGYVRGKLIDSVDLFSIEKLLDSQGEIKKSEVWSADDGVLYIEVSQRRPAVRFECGSTSFYADDNGFLFPICNRVQVPVVTGAVPIAYQTGFKGFAATGREKRWLNGMTRLALYIENNEYWSKQIEQINIENGDLILYTHIGEQKIIFGDTSDIEAKFRKLATFYKSIVPEVGWERYRIVNLKYKNQIICK